MGLQNPKEALVWPFKSCLPTGHKASYTPGEPSPYLASVKWSHSPQNACNVLAAKNLLPLKQQEEEKGNNWNDLLLQTASHLL